MAILTTLQADVIHSITPFQRCRHIHPLTPRIPSEGSQMCFQRQLRRDSRGYLYHWLYLSHPFLNLQSKRTDPDLHSSEKQRFGVCSALWRLFPLAPCQHHYTKGRPGHKISRRVNILETADSLEARRAKQIDCTLLHTIPASSASAHVSISVLESVYGFICKHVLIIMCECL